MKNVKKEKCVVKNKIGRTPCLDDGQTRQDLSACFQNDLPEYTDECALR
jgi:hypothetical protein